MKPVTLPPVCRLPAPWWMEHSELIPKPWLPETVWIDLRVWASLGSVPGVEALRRRWGWTRAAAREVIASSVWHDRNTLTPKTTHGASLARKAASSRRGRRGR